MWKRLNDDPPILNSYDETKCKHRNTFCIMLGNLTSHLKGQFFFRKNGSPPSFLITEGKNAGFTIHI